MSETNDVFNEDNTDEGNEPNFLEQLVGDGKKFKDVEALARGKAESDRYVDQLRTELENQKKLNEEKLDRLLEEIKNKGATSASGNQSQPNPNEPSRSTGENNTSSKDTAEDIESLVKKALKEQEDMTRKEANVQVVNERLSELYGEKAREVIKSRASELGVSVEQLKSMAETSPKAFLKLVANEEGKEANFSSSQSRVNTQALGVNSNNSGEQGWSYYLKLKRENPTEFWRRHEEIHQKVAKMGHDRFYNS